MGRKILKQKKIENTECNILFSKIMGYSLCGFLLFFPWITYAVNRTISDEEHDVYIQKVEGIIDNCLFSKMYVLLVFAFFIVICLEFHIFMDRKKHFQKNLGNGTITIRDIVCAATASFIVLAVLSTIMSEFTQISLWGSYNNPEGLFVILAYICLAIAAYIAFQNNHLWQVLKYIIIILAMITIALSYVEFFYKPITQILYPDGWQSDYKNMVALTFYNSGYFGGFLILLFPLMIDLFVKSKKLYEILILAFESIGLVVCVLLSKSTGAFYVMLFEILVMMIYKAYSAVRYKNFICRWKMKAIGIMAPIILCLMINVVSSGKLSEQLFSTANNETESIHRNDYHQITDISLEGNVINITSKQSDHVKKTLKVELNDTQIMFTDQESEQSVNMTQDSGNIYFHGDYQGISARIENSALIFDYGYKGEIRFYIYEKAFYPMLSDGSLVQDISGSGLSGGDFIHTATGRGYIWMNTLPLLKKCIVIGQGPATFGLYFKQFDFVGLLNSQGMVDLFIDKPHNMYLQTAEQTGVISALVMIGILMILIVHAAISQVKYLKLDKSNFDNADTLKQSEYREDLTGLTIAVCGFAILGLVNDSCITVNPIFWIISGTLFARTRVMNELIMTKKGVQKCLKK